MARVDFDDVTVAVDGKVVLRNLSFGIDDGELVGVVGPSGSGKTTLIRTIAGFTDVVAGRVLLDGVDVTNTKTAARDVGMVFQQPVLFGNRDVRRNVSFPLEIRRQEATEIAQRVNAEVRSMHIEHLLQRDPTELSRGEAQLVQIARAMVRTPRVLLLDEPLTSLDVQLQTRTRRELQMLQEGYGVTTVMTTNDPVDAVTMPSRLIVIHESRIAQIATPAQVRQYPATVDAALSTGDCWLLPATVVAAGTSESDGFWLHIAGARGAASVRLRAWAQALAEHVGELVTVGIRPDGVRAVATGSIAAQIERVVVSPHRTGMCDVAGRRIGVLVDAEVKAGDSINLQVDEFVVFDPASSRRIC